MRIPFISMFMTSPFNGLQEHAEKVKECAWAFQQAIECHFSPRCTRFEELRQEVVDLEREADAIKRRVRGHLPIGTLMPVAKFQVFLYLREQDSVIDAVEEVLNWISYRGDPGVPSEFEKDFKLLVDAVIDPIEELDKMVKDARQYFRTYDEKQRRVVKEIVHTLRQQERQADKLEDAIKHKVFATVKDPVTVFHTIRLAETIGNIADHAQNVGDMLRAMVAK